MPEHDSIFAWLSGVVEISELLPEEKNRITDLAIDFVTTPRDQTASTRPVKDVG